MVPLDPGARRAILDACDSLREDSLDWLFRLVRCPSTLGNEASALNEMERLYRHIGLEPFRVPTEPARLEGHPGFSPPLIGYEGRDNVAALHRPKTARGRSLALQGHVDVVPEGAADLWVTPPFQPAIRDGRVYGRGAGDMKAGIVSYAMAFAALRRAGLAPAAEVQMAAVIEEECTGNGALACMLALPKPDAVIIPEPGPGMEGMYAAEVGVVWAWVTVTGRPAHVRDMQAGVNAIEAAQVIAGAFKAYEAERNRAEHIHPAFHGANGVMMGYTAAETKRDIERLVAEAAAHERLRGAKVELAFKGFMADPCLFDMDSEIARLSRRCFAEATGRSLREFPATGLTDGRHYALYQDTPCAVFGPDAQEIHGIDESVGVESFHGVTRCLALAIAEWCGVEPA
ncbi:MAG: M20/M25/M40 family metallo-hydrolase [Rubritepida sp.]|nr:M20/M25/M40 family metallo-hydrolase [Rubritepida sp.]